MKCDHRVTSNCIRRNILNKNPNIPTSCIFSSTYLHMRSHWIVSRRPIYTLCVCGYAYEMLCARHANDINAKTCIHTDAAQPPPNHPMEPMFASSGLHASSAESNDCEKNQSRCYIKRNASVCVCVCFALWVVI